MPTFQSGHVSKNETVKALKSSPPTVEQQRGPSGAEALLYPTIMRDSDGQPKIVENIITPSISHSRDMQAMMNSSELFGTGFSSSPAMAHALKSTSPKAYKFAVDYQKGEEQAEEEDE